MWEGMWLVKRDGEVWTDWLESEQDGINHVNECMAQGYEGFWEVKAMKEADNNELFGVHTDSGK